MFNFTKRIWHKLFGKSHQQPQQPTEQPTTVPADFYHVDRFGNEWAGSKPINSGVLYEKKTLMRPPSYAEPTVDSIAQVPVRYTQDPSPEYSSSGVDLLEMGLMAALLLSERNSSDSGACTRDDPPAPEPYRSQDGGDFGGGGASGSWSDDSSSGSSLSDSSDSSPGTSSSSSDSSLF